jgi:pyruvate ferredoxin oxidoreductase alpha subunit
MAKIVATTGNSAIAYAMKQIDPDVCAAYPITPSTQVMEEFSKYVADGVVNTNLVAVESEHSAMSACVGAAAAGGRVMTATSANGMALMWEMLYIAAGMRLPIVLALVNRALSAPINIHCDHSDSFGARDTGWIQLYSENAQEAYDNMIQAVRISEHPDVRTPVMVCQDGFIISHSIERMEFLEDDEVRKFIGSYKPKYALLDMDNPVTLGSLDLQDYYIEHKREQHEAMKRALPVIDQVAKEFAALSGRSYGMFEAYELEDAEVGIVVVNSSAGTVKEIVDLNRKKGVKVGVLKPRVFRPFPMAAYADALRHLKAVTVLDRVDSFGAPAGPLAMEVRSALYDLPNRPAVISKIYGLGGRDLEEQHCQAVIDELVQVAGTGTYANLCEYITVRE